MSDSKRTILISGATGFIGTTIINGLNTKYNFVSIGRNKCDLCENIYWDLKSKFCTDIQLNSKTIIHCASIVGNIPEISMGDYIDINVKSTAELLEFCIKYNYEKFILISTGGVYGYNDIRMSESDLCNPQDIYSLSKYFSEKICTLFSDKIQIIILRLFYPYGNYKNDRLINRLSSSILTNKNIQLNKCGLPLINPIHTFDFINILDIMLNSKLEGIFNICGDEEISIEDLCKLIAAEARISSIKFDYTDNKVKNMIGSNNKLYNSISYIQQISLNEGIKQLVNFIKKSEM